MYNLTFLINTDIVIYTVSICIYQLMINNKKRIVIQDYPFSVTRTFRNQVFHYLSYSMVTHLSKR